LEWVLGISGSAGQGGTTVYITPCLDLSKIEVKWNNAQNLIEYTIRENAFHCKNIMWNADYGWYETPKFS
jgi:hypothetical protein